MTSLSALALSLLLLACAAAACDTGNMNAGCNYNDQADWSYIMLVETWPGTFCADGCCNIPSGTSNISDGFTMHGFWPNYEGNKYPFCCTSPFSETDLDTLIARDPQIQHDLVYYWPSLKKCKFIEYEFDKHGTCAMSVWNNSRTGPTDWIRTVIALRKRWDLLRALQNAGITPSTKRRYLPDTEIVPAIEKVVGAKVLLNCDKENLAEVRICIQRPQSDQPEYSQPFDCPESSNCPSHGIMIPPIPEMGTSSMCTRQPKE